MIEKIVEGNGSVDVEALTPEGLLALLPSWVGEKIRQESQFTEGCWVWRGYKRNGYGTLWCGHENRGNWLIHRLIYTIIIGKIPVGLQLDHVLARGCKERACFRPSHLEAVTSRDNLLRGMGMAALNARKTHCIRGHELQEKQEGAKQRLCTVCRHETGSAAKREAYATMTPEEKKAFRKSQAEGLKARLQDPEYKKEHLRKRLEARAKKRQEMTPEQAEAARLRNNENAKRWMDKNRDLANERKREARRKEQTGMTDEP